ncbi:hypothetical protein OJAV_G00052680 [Oryzias javanicus]|uniref:Uncharacterized protein n=1 Tax=Oryzias javanicus TaxID=123683 RepID=A0A437D9H9_ORYJA|nr:hypothetical protein OJAV_G00052680 [Oryzias javanicus]
MIGPRGELQGSLADRNYSSGICDVPSQSVSLSNSPLHKHSLSAVPRTTSNNRHFLSELSKNGRENHFCHKKIGCTYRMLR